MRRVWLLCFLAPFIPLALGVGVAISPELAVSLGESAHRPENDMCHATLLAELGDPANPTYGIPTEAPVAGLELLAQYVGNDVPASGTGTLTGTGTGAVGLVGVGLATPILNGRRILPATDYAGLNGNPFRAASAPGVSFGTRDFIVLTHARIPNANGFVVSNQHSNHPGWELMLSAAGNIRCQMRTVAGGIQVDERTTAAPQGSWVFGGCIFDRNGYLEAWGVDRGSGSPTSIVASSAETLHSNTYRFTIGGSPNNDTLFTSDISWVQIWACPSATPDCLTVSVGGNDYTADLKAARSKALGFSSFVAGVEVASSQTLRNSEAYGRYCDPETDTVQFEMMADNMPRVELMCGPTWDSTTGATTYRGYIPEAGATNAFASPYDATGIAWTATNVTAVADAACGATLFARDTSCTEIRASVTTSVSHSIGQAGANISAGDHAYFAVKAGAVSYAITSAGGTNWVTWDLLTCTASSQGVGVDQLIQLGGFVGGWCYVGFSGGAAMANVDIIPCDIDTATGACAYAAADITIAQIEFRYAGAVSSTGDEHGYHSPIPSGGRAEDILEHPWPLQAGPQTVIVDMLAPRNDSYIDLTVVSDNNSDVHSVSKSWQYVRTYGDVASVRLFNIVTANDIHSDQARHIIRSTWAADDVRVYVDGVLGGTDTNTGGVAPPAFNYLWFGKSANTNDNAHGNILNVQVYSGAHQPRTACTGSDVP